MPALETKSHSPIEGQAFFRRDWDLDKELVMSSMTFCNPLPYLYQVYTKESQKTPQKTTLKPLNKPKTNEKNPTLRKDT